MRRSIWRALALSSTVLLAVGCIFEDEPGDEDGGGAAGSNLGGAAESGGASGGASTGGVSGVATQGGSVVGGAATGGATTGGATTGGVTTGGVTTGGVTTGGVTTGGATTGGATTGGVTTGGVTTGGVTTGGVTTGGVTTGGVTTGGETTGGDVTGGVTTGGLATGGLATGGVETGGVETGGVETGGTGGTGGSELCAGGPLAESLADCAPGEFSLTGDFHQDCVDRINQIRMECQCLPPLERWTEAEDCADQMAAYDASVDQAHAGFTGQICTPRGWGQNECPGWGAPDEILLDSRWYEACLMMMWHEVDDPTGEQGHYVNMSSTEFTRVACGLYDDGAGNVWAVQNFQ